MTFKQAKALSVKKWKHNLDNYKIIYKMAKEAGFKWNDWGEKYWRMIEKNLPELKKLKAYCGICEYYKKVYIMYYCKHCCINMGYLNGCSNGNHLWLAWSNKPTKRNTLAMYNLVKNAKEE
jgi:hypothetical protein